MKNRETITPYREWPLHMKLVEQLYRITHHGQIRTLVVRSHLETENKYLRSIAATRIRINTSYGDILNVSMEELCLIRTFGYGTDEVSWFNGPTQLIVERPAGYCPAPLKEDTEGEDW